MYKVITLIVLVPVCLTQAQYSGGSGTAHDPYQIATAADLMLLGETPEDYSKHFILTADIDLDRNLPDRRVFSQAVIPVFLGVFDGNGYVISHLHISGKDHLGLFGKLRPGAIISNLGIEAVDVDGTGSVGSLAGSNQGSITSCYSTGAIRGYEDDVGGLVGDNEPGGSITMSYSTGVVSGTDRDVGGLVGENGGSITTSYSTGSVSGDHDVGGLVGANEHSGSITSCYSTGSVSGTWEVGGLVGDNEPGGSITTCYSAGPVSGTDRDVGGLAGRHDSDGRIRSSFWDVETSGQTAYGGGTGLTTAEMMDPYVLGLIGFANDPKWVLDAGRDYPRLAWEGTPGQVIPEPVIDWLEGQGTEQEPYRIDTADQLILLGRTSTLWHKQYILGTDIDLDPNLPGRQVFSQAVIPMFSGVFDGNGHTISHLTISGADHLGLFGELESKAIISNLGLEAIHVRAAGDHIGGLAGINHGAITNCYVTGTVIGDWSVGGLAGENGGSITTSYSTGSVSGSENVGGLVGYNYGSITLSYSTGPMRGNSEVGGIVGNGAGNSGYVNSSFWDIETSRITVSDGGSGLTTAETMDPDILGLIGFANDPNWVLDAGRDYPRLTWEGTGGQIIPEPTIDWLDGQGTDQEPYRIDTADELILLSRISTLWDKHYILHADIDLAPDLPGRRVFSQAVIPVFSGVFDGNGHTISHLTISGGDALGLFGRTSSGARISSLGLDAVEVNGHGDDIGGVVGQNYGSVLNCYSTGTVSGAQVVGGLVGSNDGSITLSYSTGSVSGSLVGGLVGSNGGRITTSYSTGTVSGVLLPGGRFAGGLVGRNGGHITTSYSTGTVTANGNSQVGGLVGENGGSITLSYSTGTVTANGNSQVGGLVGENGGSITLSYSTGSVSGGEFVGGLVGTGYGSITSSYWDIQTSGRTNMCAIADDDSFVCDDSSGLTTAQMQDINTYFSGGWDFVGEVLNGTCDFWQISPGDYPRLYYYADNGPVMPEGLGTAAQPYLIRDAWDLGTVWFKPKAHYRLERSVDLSGFTWSMAVVPRFDGVFEGNRHVISNLHILGGGYLGLFGQLGPKAMISNLGLEAVDVEGTGECVGGLAGISEGSITSSYSTGTVTGKKWVGGLAGINVGTVASSFSSGMVTGNRDVGGLVGGNGGHITTSYSTGTVTGGGGGLVGEDCGRITYSYSTGTVTVGGGLVGRIAEFCQSTILFSFWDTQTSGQTHTGGGGGTGLTTAEMQTASTFLEAGWDFIGESANGTEEIWWIDEGKGYPSLWWFLGASFPTPPHGATDVTPILTLGWLARKLVTHHDVYFGDDAEAVARATTETPGIYRGRQSAEATTYDPGLLEMNRTYYWRIDNVPEGQWDNPWKGRVWSFTTWEHLVVAVLDDFESYEDSLAGAPPLASTWVSAQTGGAVGLVFVETENGLVHDGAQSLQFLYWYVAEPWQVQTERSWETPQNWLMDNADTLTLYFRGALDNDPDPLYVAIEDSAGRIAAVTHPDAEAVQATEWQRWHIALSDLQTTGVDISSVKKMAIGVGDGNESFPIGKTIYIDDISLTNRML